MRKPRPREGQGLACSQRPELPTCAEAQPCLPGQGAQGHHEDRAPERHLPAGQDRPPSRPAGHLPEGQQHPQHLHLPRGREGGCEAGPWGWGSPAGRLGRARGHWPALHGPRAAGRPSAGDPESMGKGGGRRLGGSHSVLPRGRLTCPPPSVSGRGARRKPSPALLSPASPSSAASRRFCHTCTCAWFRVKSAEA